MQGNEESMMPRHAIRLLLPLLLEERLRGGVVDVLGVEQGLADQLAAAAAMGGRMGMLALRRRPRRLHRRLRTTINASTFRLLTIVTCLPALPGLGD
jgi:hypothetical protein